MNTSSLNPEPTSPELTNPKLTVVIPTLNEAKALPALLEQLQEQSLALSVVVADGGSVDETASIALKFGAKLVLAEANRAAQMNAGAAMAEPNGYLLFLHADSALTSPTLLADALQALQLEEGLRTSKQVPIAGHFALRFDGQHSDSDFAFRYLQTKTTLNRVNSTNGDQGMLLQKQHFISLGGFDESLPFLEDQRFAEKLRATGRWLTLPGYLVTSARRFESEGFSRRYTLMSIIMAMHTVGSARFFAGAGALYRAQHDTARLRMSPFIRLTWESLRAMGWPQRVAVGQYISANAWQLFLMLQLKCQRQIGRVNWLQQPQRKVPGLLQAYDRYLAWVFANRVTGAITMLLAGFWFFAVLWPIYKLRDRQTAND